MTVRVVLFAGLAAALGVREEDLQLPDSATAGDVYRHYLGRLPSLGKLGETVLLAVNADFSGPDTPLQPGDEVALLPPMSGGSGAVDHAALPRTETGLRREPLAPAPTEADWSGGPFGAVVTFEGVVRGHTASAPGRVVIALEYEAYEVMAERRLAAIAREAASKWPLLSITILHRLGRLQVGEVSVRVTVASAHRGDAFAACRFAIDTLKNSVPIWKKEHFTDGTTWADGEFPH